MSARELATIWAANAGYSNIPKAQNPEKSLQHPKLQMLQKQDTSFSIPEIKVQLATPFGSIKAPKQPTVKSTPSNEDKQSDVQVVVSEVEKEDESYPAYEPLRRLSQVVVSEDIQHMSLLERNLMLLKVKPN